MEETTEVEAVGEYKKSHEGWRMGLRLRVCGVFRIDTKGYEVYHLRVIHVNLPPSLFHLT